ncbi:MAG: methylated-DNA--[protein]-cysteine S-methyltransferase [Pseudomonadota bacterium]
MMMTTTMTTAPTKSSMTTIRQAFGGVPLLAQGVIDSPIGPLTALATARGIAGLWFDDQTHHPGALDAPVNARQPHILAMQRWLDAYWAGREPAPQGVTLDLHGSPFQRAVWQALLTIPFGRTRTYGEVAVQAGSDAVSRDNHGGVAARATGSAVGRNPVSILVPCHRVIGANGSLTGYAGGLPRKEHLLRHEGVLLA